MCLGQGERLTLTHFSEQPTWCLSVKANVEVEISLVASCHTFQCSGAGGKASATQVIVGLAAPAG